MAAKTLVEQARGANVGRPTIWESVKGHEVRISDCEKAEARMDGKLKVMLELQIATLGLVIAVLIAAVFRAI